MIHWADSLWMQLASRDAPDISSGSSLALNDSIFDVLLEHSYPSAPIVQSLSSQRLRNCMHSGITQFVVGKDRQKIFIYTALTSLFPKEILQPPMIEEIDNVLFGRCFELVYSGDYSVPSPIYESHNWGTQLSGCQKVQRVSKYYVM